VTDRRRDLPSVDRLLRSPAVAAACAGVPHAVLVRAVREAVEQVREGSRTAPASEALWARAIAEQVTAAAVPTLQRVINATGVVLHTNLGRAPLARQACDAMVDVAGGYSALEFDLVNGTRGSRHLHCTGLLTELTGAQDAMVVNNAAAALVLVLATAAGGGNAIVSRGELIEIGGGFRIPDIMAQSGATLIEVGTTNRTRIADYEKALAGKMARRQDGKRAGKLASLPACQLAVFLKVHRSNFSMRGFTAEASLAELVALGKKRRVPVLYDLGGGLMTDLGDRGLTDEPTLPQAAACGAAAVVASGDKLLGGPQAGIIVGTRKFLAACRAHPLARAVRADKLTLAGLAATLGLYRDAAAARREVPVLRMLTATAAELAPRAEELRAALPAAAQALVIATRSTVGGGAFPGAELASWGVALQPPGIAANELAARLRAAPVPVIGVVHKGRVVLDVRTLLASDLPPVAAAVVQAIAR
jgi:L-seryl-tRNA(Ser) seleniumtransferase